MRTQPSRTAKLIDALVEAAMEVGVVEDREAGFSTPRLRAANKALDAARRTLHRHLTRRVGSTIGQVRRALEQQA